MKLVLVSDTHGMLDQVHLPAGDVLVHAGDLTGMGELQEIEAVSRQFARIAYKFDRIICIAGNHDWGFELQPSTAVGALMSAQGLNGKLVYLQNTEYVYGGLKFYGSPFQPRFGDWAFNVDRGERLAACWSLIPDDVDVLITHGPPASVLDITRSGKEVGCKDLADRIANLHKLRLHAFGHIHESYGQITVDRVQYVNASTCTLCYKPTNAPIVVGL